ncbi:sialate O-acetylesterase [Niabella ginsenosidivorans]|uniref:Sialate O-acetylesterase n=1 Tax=Niabella ginsenosidivorans TaxID=1176587 RepID=A0A1A9I5U9_9BACT|nr:GDSL-type esterase/lipase family protein [Niabella ginsenosidivorans]ANH83038.1 sialate O-acetylesterase [Niabella ginsenosidivorans]
MYKRPFCFLVMILWASVCYAQQRLMKVACIGNSVTYGWGLKDPAQMSYPALLQQKLGDQYEVRNFGHNGATLLRKGHNPYFKTKEFQELLQFKPAIAVIDLGLNDTDPRDFPNYRDHFMVDYNWLIDTIRSMSPGVKIFICRLTPLFTGHSRFMSSTFDWYWKVQEKIRKVAAANNLPLIDLYQALHNRPDVFTDAATLHPNETGAGIIAQTIYQYITGKFGGLQLPPVFTDNMVLQRDEPVKIWGKANAGAAITVKFMTNKQTVIAGYDGKWQVLFPASKAVSAPQVIEISSLSTRVTIRNVLIGDVWLCSGQSNMYFPLSQTTGADSLLQNTDSLQPLRLFKYKPYAETDNRPWTNNELRKANELDFFSGSWQLNHKKAAADFSVVGYIFGARLLKEVNVPVGLIEVAVGGSPLISWVSRYALEAAPLFEPAFHNWRQSDYLMQWCRQRADVNLKNAASPFQRHPYDPSFNFEAAIEKLIPYPVKGVIWYQGESDAENAELYQKLFPVFVKDWRNQWQKDLPFYYVQLSSINRPSWNYFRDVQRNLINQVDHCGMVVTSDLGDTADVHYKNKIPVGNRLAGLALNKTYHKSITPSGPLFQSLKKTGNQIRIRFQYATGLKAANGRSLEGFEIMSGKGAFIKVPAVVKADEVIITIPEGVHAEKVAYAWQPFTRANLVNGDLLPASTFIEPVK